MRKFSQWFSEQREIKRRKPKPSRVSSVSKTPRGFRQRMFSYLISFLGVFVVVVYLFVFGPFAQLTEAAWFNDSWAYRKAITLTNNTSNETNKYGTLSSYDASDTTKYQSDCGDVRFTTASGDILAYTVSSCGASTTFHVNVESLPAGAQTIYLYYGNPSAANGFVSTDPYTACTNCTFGSPASEEKGTGPVVYWKFDEGQGTTVEDSTANNMDGIYPVGTTAGPINIDDASNFGTFLNVGRQLVRSSTGTFYAVLNKSGTCEVWKSTTGSSWTKPATGFSCSGSGATMSVAIDSSDNLHIGYIGTTNIEYIKYTTSTDTFGSAEIVLASANGNGCYISIAVDSNNVPHVVHYNAVGNIEYDNRIGGSWNSSDVTVESAGLSIPLVDIAISEDNIPEIIYQNVIPTPDQLTAAVGNANDATSFTLQDIDTSINETSNTRGSSIAIDSSGNTWVAYVDGTNNDVTLIKHNDADAWSSWQSATNSGSDGKEPSVVAVGSTIYVVYESVTNANDIAYNIYTGGWAGESVLQAGTTLVDVKAKWSFLNNNNSAYQLDYLYSDGTDVFYKSLAIGSGSSPEWKTEDQCVAGKCLYFDGTNNDSVTKSDDSKLDFAASDNFTVSAWVKRNGVSSAINYIVSKADTTNGGYKLWMEADGDLCFGVDDDATWDATVASLDAAGCSSSARFDDDKWHYVAGVRSVTDDKVYVYVDGIERSGGDTDNSSGTLANSNDFYVGVDRDGTSNEWLGYIDEVKVYNSALSAAQVKANYNSRGAVKGASVTSANMQNMPPALSNGLTGYWEMDESSWNGTTSEVVDASGNANHGTAQPAGGTLGITADTSQVSGTTNTTANQSSTSHTLTSAMEAGHLAVLTVAVDNNQTTDGDEGAVSSITDSAGGNTWTKASEFTNGQGSAQAGATISVWYSVITNQISSSGTITANFTNNTSRDASRISVQDFIIGTGNTISVAATPQTLATDASTTGPGNLTISGLTNGEYLFFRAVAEEGNEAPGNQTTGYTSYSGGATSGGGATSNIGNFAEYKIATATGDTAGNATGWTANSRDYASTFIAFKETSPGTPPTTGAGKFGNSGSFNGTNQNVRITESTSVDVGDTSSSFTASAWFKTSTDFSSIATIFAKGAASSSYPFLIYMSSTERVCINTSDGTNSPDFCDTSTTYNDGLWHQVTVVRNTSTDTIYLYVDGALKNSATDTTTATTANNDDISIGNSGTSYTAFDFTGSIDEARIYNRALSAADVSLLYNWGPGPVGRWDFEEKQGQTLYDRSSNGFNGTLGLSTSVSTDDPTWDRGRYGGGLNFDGGDQVTYSTNTSLNVPTITVEAWVKSTDSTALRTAVARDNSVTVNRDWLLGQGASASTFRFAIFIGNTQYDAESATNFSLNTWHHLVGTYDGSNVRLYVDGVNTATTSITGSLDTDAVTLTIGSREPTSIPTQYWIGSVDDVNIYTYSRTQKQIIEDMNAGHPAPGSPVGSAVAYWKFDEGNGTTAYDTNSSTGGAENLTLSTATSAWITGGKFGKAFNVVGARWAQITDTAASNEAADNLDFAATDDFSISFWMKSASTNNPIGGATEYLVTKGTITNTGTVGYAIIGAGNGGMQFAIRSTSGAWGASSPGTISADDSITTYDVYDTKWHYITVTKTGTSEIDIYVDGVLDTRDPSLTANGSLANDANFMIGDDDGDATNSFNGIIDEVKVYRSALTAAQIKADYNRGAGQVWGALSDTSKLTGGSVASQSASAEYCVPGDTTACTAPVGRWDFEEGTGNPNDTSGNGNGGTLNGSTGYTSGKYGKGVAISGSSDYVSVANTITTKTVTFWVKPTSTTANLIDLRTAATVTNISVSSGTVSATGFPATTTIYVNGVVNGTLTANRWSFVAVTTTGTAISANAIKFGRINATTNLVGSIDAIRFYDYTRSAAQIAWDYNRGGPVGWWKMDECQGTSIYDSSGSSLTGTLNGTGAGTTAVGTCSTASSMWGGSAGNSTTNSGKRNYALTFDGTDDYVNVTDNDKIDLTGDFTLAAWINASNGGGWRNFLSKYNADSLQWVFQLQDSLGFCTLGSGVEGGLMFNMEYSGTYAHICDNKALDDGTWHHVVVMRSGSTLSLYVDGKFRQSGTASSISLANSLDMRIGGTGTGIQWFGGKIDDVRIFQYALTPAQMKVLYTGGAVVFAPITGAP